MSWTVTWDSSAARDMRRLDLQVRERVNAAVERLAARGYGDVQRIQGATQLWRLRVGDWRVLFTYMPEDQEVRIKRVRHRREAYR